MESRWRLFAVLVLLGALLVPVAGAGAEEFSGSEVPSSFKGADTADLAKVSSHLLEARRLVAAGAPDVEIASATASSRFSDGDPFLELRFEKLTEETIARVEALGFRTLGAYPEYAIMSGYASLDVLDELAALPELAVVHPQYGYALHPGSTTSQADVSINADDARAAFGVDGSGITVGVLSDSFNSSLGGTVSGSGCTATVTSMNNQLSGDLPDPVTLLDNGGSGTDEGAAMAELIYDLAPGADIMYHTALPGGEAFFASGIAELASCGADVIVDDITYFAEPMFQDGFVAQAAQAVVDGGIPYYSSAGNNATYGVMDSYLDSNPGTDDFSFPASGDDFHDFGGGDRFAEVTLGTGEGVRFVLQWNDPFSGTLGPGSAADMDLLLFDTPDPAATPIASSTSVQGGTLCDGRSGDPLEIVNYINETGSEQTVYLAVEHFCGSEDRQFRIATFGSGQSITALDFETAIFNDAQVFGHAAAAGAAAVAAIDYKEIDSGGSADGSPGTVDVEAFSSQGGDIPIYFDAAGNPLPGAPLNRFKPEITAPDDTNTTFFGGDSDGDGFPNFPGTSAAAPHAAAVAALMLEVNPALTPAEILNTLKSTAIDIEGPGIDTLSGSGLIDAFSALSATPSPDTTPPSWPGASLSVSNIAADGATLSWSPATDSALQGAQTAAVASYKVYLNGAVYGSTASTSLTVTGLSPGTTYTAKVEAVDGAGNESTNGPSTTFTTLNPLPPGGSFTDDNGNVHEGNIEAIAFAGITRGCNPPVNDKYCPDKNVTRGQMAAFLVRALNLTDDGGGNSFVDDNGSTFETDIAKLAAAGITRGCNPPVNDRFCPDKNVTRGQMAAFLVRALNLTDDGGGNSFVDDDGSTFESDIAKLAAAGITLGCNPPANDRFCPDSAVKRGQMASFLARALNLAPIVPPPATQSFGDGVWTVPGEVTPGTYRNSDSSDACYWARLSGFSGELEDVIANEFTYEIDIVTVEAGDVGFESSRCGTWSTNLSPRTSSPTASFGGGTFLVGTEVAAGTWRNSDSSDGCYWERLSGFSGELGDIIVNAFTYDIQTVTVTSTDLGFSSEGCGTWSKIG